MMTNCCVTSVCSGLGGPVQRCVSAVGGAVLHQSGHEIGHAQRLQLIRMVQIWLHRMQLRGACMSIEQ